MHFVERERERTIEHFSLRNGERERERVRPFVCSRQMEKNCKEKRLFLLLLWQIDVIYIE